MGRITNRVGTVSLAATGLGWLAVETVFARSLAPLQLGPLNAQSLLSAIFEAGLVGGCADWWAVTALFRHPLGLRLPHTRIVPKKKAELAAGVKDMIQTLLSKESIEYELQRRNLGRSWLDFLQRGKETGLFFDLMDGSIPTFLDELRTRAILTPATRELTRFLEEDVDYAKLTAELLRFSLDRNLDRMLIQFTLNQAKDFLSSQRDFLAREIWRVAERSTGEGLTGWLKRKLMNVGFGPGDIEGALRRVDRFIDEKLSPSGEYYSLIRDWLLSLPSRIEKEEELRNIINLQTRKIITNAELQDVLKHANELFADHIESEWKKPREKRFELFVKLTSSIFDALRNNERSVEQIDRMIKQLFRTALSSEQIIDHAARIAGKNLAEMSDENLIAFIENKVGNDLQFIRLNGAMVGGLVGGFLYSLKAFLS